jgi:hypothetical protein
VRAQVSSSVAQVSSSVARDSHWICEQSERLLHANISSAYVAVYSAYMDGSNECVFLVLMGRGSAMCPASRSKIKIVIVISKVGLCTACADV